MRLSRFLLVSGGVLLAGARPAAAQQPAPPNLATDTLQPANPHYYHPVSHVRTTGGADLFVFMSALPAHPRTLEFTWRNPMTLPRPRPMMLELDKVQWLRTGNHFFEPVRLLSPNPRKPYRPEYLAWRRSTGPWVELFDIGWPKTRAGEYLPVVGIAVTALARVDSSKFDHVWLLLRPGDPYMTWVPYGRKAVPFLADFMVDVPELAAAIRQAANTPGYRFDDLPALVARHNAQPRVAGK